MATLPGLAERTLTISSVGKTFSVTGWKVGWVHGPGELVSAVRAVKQFLTYVSGAPFQPAIAAALGLPDSFYTGLAADLQRKRDLLSNGLRDAGFTVFDTGGTYFVVTDVTALGFSDGAEFCWSLPERVGVAAVPVSVFCADPDLGRSLVRFAFCKRDEVLQEAVSAGWPRCGRRCRREGVRLHRVRRPRERDDARRAGPQAGAGRAARPGPSRGREPGRLEAARGRLRRHRAARRCSAGRWPARSSRSVLASSGFAVDDEVFGGTPGMVGGWAEQSLVMASFAAHRPEGVSPADAAALPVAAGTAYDALNGLDLAPGSTLLVNGAGGGVGVVTLQLARARGLVVVGTASKGKHDLVASYGAIPVEYGDGVAERIRAAAPQGVDAVLDTVGGDALRAVAGVLSDLSRLATIADRPLAAELGGHGVERDRSTAVLSALARLVADGALDPHVTEIRPLDEAGAALATVEAGHTRGKVAIRVG